MEVFLVQLGEMTNQRGIATFVSLFIVLFAFERDVWESPYALCSFSSEIKRCRDAWGTLLHLHLLCGCKSANTDANVDEKVQM